MLNKEKRRTKKRMDNNLGSEQVLVEGGLCTQVQTH